jgi:hypothetical protein
MTFTRLRGVILHWTETLRNPATVKVSVTFRNMNIVTEACSVIVPSAFSVSMRALNEEGGARMFIQTSLHADPCRLLNKASGKQLSESVTRKVCKRTWPFPAMEATPYPSLRIVSVMVDTVCCPFDGHVTGLRRVWPATAPLFRRSTLIIRGITPVK